MISRLFLGISLFLFSCGSNNPHVFTVKEGIRNNEEKNADSPLSKNISKQDSEPTLKPTPEPIQNKPRQRKYDRKTLKDPRKRNELKKHIKEMEQNIDILEDKMHKF